MRNKRFGKLLSAALAAAMALSLSSAALAAGNGETHLTIIGTSDTHGNIWGYSYEDMKESTGDGLARVSAYVNQVRSENPNTILVDAGDTIQGTIMTDDLYSKDTASPPVAAALNYMDYDAWTLGNHEFNFGVDTLKSILEQVDMPVLAANIKNADGSYFTGAGYTIVMTPELWTRDKVFEVLSRIPMSPEDWEDHWSTKKYYEDGEEMFFE